MKKKGNFSTFVVSAWTNVACEIVSADKIQGLSMAAGVVGEVEESSGHERKGKEVESRSFPWHPTSFYPC